MIIEPVRAYVVLSCKETFEQSRETSMRRLRVLRKSGFDESKSIEARSLRLFLEQLDHFHRSWVEQGWHTAHNEAIVRKCFSVSEVEQRYSETLRATLAETIENLSTRNNSHWRRRVLMAMGEFEGQACLRVDRLVVRFAESLLERLSHQEAPQSGTTTPRMRVVAA